VDIAYLYYLPFCTLFTSSDKLHRQCAPLFMRSNQEFVWGLDLKADLRTLNAHFSALPVEVKQQGIYKFANRLPIESQGLIRKLFERHTPSLLTQHAVVDPDKIKMDVRKRLIEDVKGWDTSPSISSSRRSTRDALETMIIKRSISRSRGSWLQIGPEVKDDA
jgi:hypothetical protein